jgi:hypothetical protein
MGFQINDYTRRAWLKRFTGKVNSKTASKPYSGGIVPPGLIDDMFFRT